jgi:hypothetical protein
MEDDRMGVQLPPILFCFFFGSLSDWNETALQQKKPAGS